MNKSKIRGITISALISIALVYLLGIFSNSDWVSHSLVFEWVVYGIGAAVFVTFGILIYFAPTIVAYNQHHKQLAVIFAINLLLGWTLVGWVVALCITLWEVKQP